MVNLFDEEPARLHARYLARLITETGFLDFDSDRGIPANEQAAVMIGVLLGTDGNGNEVLLKGISGGRRNLRGYVPHLIPDAAYRAYLDAHDPVIKDPCNTPPERRGHSARALRHYYGLYRFPTVFGGTVTLAECFGDRPIPTGSGDCAAIKLLAYALDNDIRPTSMTEFFYGAGARSHLEFHHPCTERCSPILRRMLGLDPLYRDEHLLILDKPPHLRSIPGTVESDSIESRVRTLIPSAPVHCATHRLDMDASGLIVVALTAEALSGMHRLFRTRQVRRNYEALIEGILKKEKTEILLPLRSDRANRPYQVVDHAGGKEARTLVKRIRVEEHPDGHLTRVELTPYTGRTHQLRIHCREGLGLPILGDRLYGTGMKSRLHLHARTLEFSHPVTGKELHIDAPVPF
ncbi:MAG: RluA family pseudouridine synthase [Spirochaetales bacterium]|nr:RluA family pseudouridine synthase [Spirochaetales bacterium]